MPTILKKVKGFPGYYAGSDGSVWSKWRTRGRAGGGRGVESYISDTLKQMKGVHRPDGYTRICLRKEGKGYDFLLHRLILETFKGSCPEGMECCHEDGNKSNCRLSNLYWGTRLENIQDAIRHGTFYNATKAAALVNRGKERSQEIRDKISAGNSGKPKSDAHKAALVENHWSKRQDASEIAEKSASKNRGKKHSEEHRARISESMRQAHAKRRRGNI